MRRTTSLAVVMMFVCISVTPTQAMPMLFTGTDGTRLAHALFDTQGNDLVVTLSNMGPDVLTPSDILNAVFFNLSGDPVLGSVSALIAPGSTYVFDNTAPMPDDGVVGGEWAYETGLTGPNFTSQGISSVGYGLFGNPTFPGPNLEGPDAVNGMGYGLTSINDDLTTGNAPVTGDNPFLQYSVVFTLSGLPEDFDPLTDVTNVWFQYETSLTGPGFPGNPIPEPTTLLLLGGGILGMGIFRSLRRRGR